MKTSCSNTVLPLMAGVIAAFYVSTAIGASDLTRPVAHDVLKKSVNFEHDKCILDKSMKRLVQFESDNIKLLCSVEKLEITGIAKTNQSEPIVEYDVITNYDPSNLKQLLGAIQKQKKYWEDLHDRYVRDPVALTEVERLLARDARGNVLQPGEVEKLEEMEKVVQRLDNEPVAIRKAQALFRLYDDGWRVIETKWIGYATRKPSESEIAELEKSQREQNRKALLENVDKEKKWEEAKKLLFFLRRHCLNNDVAALVQVLGDVNQDFGGASATCLGKVGPGAVPALIEALSSPNVQTRAHAAFALGETKHVTKDTARALVKALSQDQALVVRDYAAHALRAFRPLAKDVVPALIQALDVRFLDFTALSVLDAFGPEAADAVPALIKMLGNENVTLREKAASALGSIGPAAQDALPALRNLKFDSAIRKIEGR